MPRPLPFRRAIQVAAALSPLPWGTTQATELPLDPTLSVVLDGVYYDDSAGGDGDTWLSETAGIFDNHDHDAGPGHAADEHGLEQGLHLRHTEISLTAGIEKLFDARVNLAISDEGEIELEEAFIASAGLPAGLRIKAGKFYSGIGYANERHPHHWDFVDQNLAYRNLLGIHGLSDTGLQVTWQPAGAHGTRLGIEAFQGDNKERLGTEAAHTGDLPGRDSVPRLWTAFAKWSPDLGHDHALHFGASTAFFRSHQAFHHHDEPDEHGLDGDARLWGLDAAYLFHSDGLHGQGDWRVSAEYLVAEKNLEIAHHASDPGLVGEARDFTQDGLYLQATYGIAPRWELGLRYDAAGFTNKKRGPSVTVNADFEESERWTAAAAWRVSDTSRLRAQVARASAALDSGREHYDQIYLQYQWRFAVGHRRGHQRADYPRAHAH
ncbi:TonB-dependent receptor [Guyparkeria sp. 1SP6A2]|nr:TonB-dependent receptor [Guyparkeria sp. 1SP6A2]